MTDFWRMENVLKKLKMMAGLMPALALAAVADSGSFPADLEALTRGPHRLTGTMEYRAAADHVKARLEQIGVDEVIVQEFPAAQTVTKRCELVFDGGQKIPLVPARPDGIIPPVSSPEGITGELVWLGAGRAGDFERADPQGKIAVMDYNTDDQWLKAFRLGAKAVIFTRQEPCESRHHHHVRANANLPRFYYDGPASNLTEGARVSLHSEIVWEKTTGRNVIGYLKGTDPVFDLGKEEVIIISANLDSFGEIPERTPGARPAANCAALLQLAEMLRDQRPRRGAVFLFADGQARSHAGARAFYEALEDKVKQADLDARMKAWKTESSFIRQVREQMKKDDPLADRISPSGKELLKRLRSAATDYAQDIRGQLMELRAKEKEDESADFSARIDELASAQNRWNDLRRELGRGSVSENSQPLFREVLKTVHASVEARASELRAAKAMLDSSLKVRDLLADRWIALHISLMLGDTTERWGVVIGGDADIHSAQDDPGLYGRIQGSFLRAWESLEKGKTRAAHFEPASVDGRLTQTRLLWNAPMLIHGGEIAGRHGIYNIVLGTMHETLPREGTPDDTAEFLNTDIIRQTTREIALLLAAVASLETQLGAVEAVADQEGLSLRRAIAADKQYITAGFENGRATGALVMGRQRGSSIPNRPVPGAVVQISLVDPWNNCFWPHNKPYAFDPFIVTMTDENGAYSAGSLPEDEYSIFGFSASFDRSGRVVMTSENKSYRSVLTRLNMLNVNSGLLMLPPSFWPQNASVMNARANASISGDDSDKAYAETADGVVYWFAEEKLKGIKAFGLNSIVALINDRPVEGGAEMYGAGYPAGRTDWLSLKNSEQSAWDLWRLNEGRLAILRSRDILNSSLEELHGRIRDSLDEAARTDSPALKEALAASAFMSATPVYEMIRTSMDDLVKAVLVLLALCVPFAFALERLLIGSNMIYKQVGWFTGFFTLTFIILYLSHPAFAIAKTPVIIFLGFAVVLLSVLVIFIIMRKFEAELKALQGMTASIHAADISRFNTVMAAMAMGISTMRRRPLRTALTAITIILLTFTILCFASFDTRKGIMKLFSAPSPAYTGVVLRNPTWGSYNLEFVDVIRSRWEKDAEVCTRFWICPEFARDPDFVVALADGSNPVAIKGMLGLSPQEIRRRDDLKALLQITDGDDLDSHAFMTEAVAELLNVKPGDEVLLKGLRLKVGPLISASALSTARDMDGSSILPVDFAQMKAAQKDQTVQSDDMTQEQDTWTSLPVDSIIITSAENTRRAGGKPHLIAIYTEDAGQASDIAEEAARMQDKTPVLATRTDGVYRHILGTVMAASGVGDLFFPVLLGGLVIFGTMLGSVADREKEIFTFSALGLAPPHVASLFFAEAMVYSVIGGLGGYLIAQGSMKLLGLAATYGLVRVPEMNYSSTNAIVTILIVMATVLVSAIYPAIKASRSANPGLLRSWKLPPPKGDTFDLVFPFTVSGYDLTGVVSFLREHFESFSDTGLGSFMARDAHMTVAEDGGLGISARLALAPFDLGVTETLELRSKPSGIEGIDEINIRLTRLSGQPKDWERLNKVLLVDLRTQFLLWRSLPQETMEIYRHRTLSEMKKHGA